MTSRKTILSFAVLVIASVSVHAQWRSESYDLPGGWSAIHVPVDPGNVSIDQLMEQNFQVQEIWEWRPEGLDTLILEDPQSPVAGAEWGIWKRLSPRDSTLHRLSAHRSYLIRTDDPVVLSIKGRVVAPNTRWRSDGLNLLGFSTYPGDLAPKAEAFLGPAQIVDQATEIFGYTGGPLQLNVNPQRQAPQFTPIVRHRAYWIRTAKYSDYDGPIRVRMAVGDGIDFGDSVPTRRIVLTNRTTREMTATLSPVSSQSPPNSQTAPQSVPLTRQVFTNGQESYVAFGDAYTVTLRAGETVGVTVGVNRAAMTGGASTIYASLMRVTDGEDMTQTYLPVTAEKPNLVGLWVGKAEITHVQNLLASGETADLQPAAQVFPLQLVAFVAGQDIPTYLLSQAYLGAVAQDAGGPILGATTEESRILPAFLSSARRFTCAHLPLGARIAMSDQAAPGVNLAGALTLEHDSSSNPFLHVYHPDHDNLDARFENALPAGVESHRVVRDIRLNFHSSPPTGLTNPAWGTTLLTGEYRETLSGLHKRGITTKGVFALHKVASTSILLP